jgi:hypothetical protein
MKLFRLPTEVADTDALELYRRFIAITSAAPWTKRLHQIEALFSDEFKRGLYEDAFPFERAMLATQLFFQRRGQLPPIESAEQYGLMAFIANTVHVFDLLSSAAKKQFRGRLIHGLKSESGLTPLAFEMSVVGAIASRGCQIGFSDFETPGGFDFLVDNSGLMLEVECKTLSRDVGRRIKQRPALEVYCNIKNQISDVLPRLRSGLVLKAIVRDNLTNESRLQAVMSRLILRALATGVATEDAESGVQIQVLDFNMADSPFGHGSERQIPRQRLEDFVFGLTAERNREVLAFYRPNAAAVVVVLASQQGDNDVHEWLREARSAASRQFSKERPGILCVHFDGLTNAQLLSLAGDEVSGLSISATRILNNEDRAHLVSVVYFARLTQEPVTIQGSAVSVPGSVYITHNPFHPTRDDARANLFSAKRVPASHGTATAVGTSAANVGA